MNSGRLWGTKHVFPHFAVKDNRHFIMMSFLCQICPPKWQNVGPAVIQKQSIQQLMSIKPVL